MLGVVLYLEEAGSGQVGEGGNDGFIGKWGKGKVVLLMLKRFDPCLTPGWVCFIFWPKVVGHGNWVVLLVGWVFFLGLNNNKGPCGFVSNRAQGPFLQLLIFQGPNLQRFPKYLQGLFLPSFDFPRTFDVYFPN